MLGRHQRLKEYLLVSNCRIDDFNDDDDNDDETDEEDEEEEEDDYDDDDEDDELFTGLRRRPRHQTDST